MNDIVVGKASPGELQKYAEWLRGFADSPIDAVHALWPWQVKGGPLENEPGPDTWQTKALNEIGAQMRAGEPIIRLAVASGHGVGKQLIDSERVFLSDGGRKEIGSLVVGDEVIGGNGDPCRVTGVFPQGVNSLYRMHFSDGTSILAGLDHQWAVKSKVDRAKKRDWRVLTTEQIKENFSRGYSIPMCGAVSWPAKQTPLHPYVVGYLIANGAVKHGTKIVSTCSQDMDIINRINSLLPHGYNINYGSRKRGVFGGAITKKEDHGGGANEVYLRMRFMGKCEHKAIPEEYMHNSVENRIELLRGLMDGDGCCATRKGRKGMRCVYSTSSSTLRDQIIYLVRSLGGICGYSTDDRRGKKVTVGKCSGVTRLINYQLTVNLPNHINPFFCERKKSLYDGWVESGSKMQPQRFIRSIEYECEAGATCISVDNNDHLYLAGDFVVTHNSALVSWMTHTFQSCRYDAQTVVTANTATQLKTKTWRELAKWHRMAVNSWMFDWTATAYKCVLSPETWYAQAIPWSDSNPEGFAGLHAEHVLVQFDEASAISDTIWEVAEGAMTTPGAVFLCYGNPTRNSGRFHRIMQNPKSGWSRMRIDSREARHRNDKLIQDWLEEWGEDSDFFRVRVRGMPPKHGSLQMIPSQTVVDAMNRTIPDEVVPPEFPKIMGVDVARQGDNESVIVIRQWRKLQPKIRRYMIRNTFLLAQEINIIINRERPDAVFVDGVGIGAGVVDSLINHFGHRNVFEVQAGAKPVGGPKAQKIYLNLRVQMWAKMAKWIEGADLPNKRECESAEDLEIQLTAPEYGFMANSDKMKLESKKEMADRGEPSPDIADALALTFAQDLPPKLSAGKGLYGMGGSEEPDYV